MPELCAQLLQPRLLLLLCVCFRFQLCLFLFLLRPALLADRFRAALEGLAVWLSVLLAPVGDLIDP